MNNILYNYHPSHGSSSLDLATANYRLSSSSPARDAGTSADAPATDILGTARPQNGVFDIGAYEYTNAAVTRGPSALPHQSTARFTARSFDLLGRYISKKSVIASGVIVEMEQGTQSRIAIGAEKH